MQVSILGLLKLRDQMLKNRNEERSCQLEITRNTAGILDHCKGYPTRGGGGGGRARLFSSMGHLARVMTFYSALLLFGSA